MYKITLIIFSLIYFFSIKIDTFAKGKGILEGTNGTVENIRTGNLHIEDIAGGIKGMIDIFLGMSGTIAVIFVIIGAYKLLFASVKGDHTKGRETIVMALTGFAISALAWFIVKFIFNNFS